MCKRLFIIVTCISISIAGFSQSHDSLATTNRIKDSVTIAEMENVKGKPKVLHAEPLYIDLIRDLGARKGEREWNIGMGMTDNLKYDEINLLVEYEFAPIDRLGFEVELPVLFYSKQKNVDKDSIPSTRLESLKMATQWSFFVSEKMKTSMALGYIHEFVLSPMDDFGKPLFTGNVFNPFLVAAKRWGQNFHTLVYTGPRVEKERGHKTEWRYDINTNFHYMIPGTRNFVGIELNKNLRQHDFDMVIRPQMRVGISENLLVGIVGGVPVNRENQRFSMFTRIIWEPKTKAHVVKKTN